MEKTPHFSRIVDFPETINPITGRSLFYGLRPWRCDDRFQDWLASFMLLSGPSMQFHLLRTLYKCHRSEVGKEPLDDYQFLTRKEVMFYVERSKCGMMRAKFLETYPYDQTALQRISEEDALKMRVWRNQRQMELEAKEGKVDELLQSHVLNATRRKTAAQGDSGR